MAHDLNLNRPQNDTKMQSTQDSKRGPAQLCLLTSKLSLNQKYSLYVSTCVDIANKGSNGQKDIMNITTNQRSKAGTNAFAIFHDDHRFRECNGSKNFFRAKEFRQHLKHRHTARIGGSTELLDNVYTMVD